MHLEIIRSHEQLAELRAAWEAVYAADPEARFFLSWTWLSGWFRRLGSTWFVVAAKADEHSDEYLGFLPLQKQTRVSKCGKEYVEISLGGSKMSDDTGFICVPEMQREVIVAFSKYLAQMQWAVLRFDWLSMSEERASLFLARFASKQFKCTEREVFNDDNINLNIYPFIRLPDSWDDYLTGRLGTNTRQKTRRFLRKLDAGDDLRVTHATEDTFRRDFEIMMKFWVAKWVHEKREQTRPIVQAYAVMLQHCLQQNALFMPTLWRGDTPLGTLAFLVDLQKKSMLFKVSGLDTSSNNPPPGFLLHSYSIRHAISAGFRTFELLQGNEPYKYSFGAEERRVRWLSLRRPVGSRASKAGFATPFIGEAPARQPLELPMAHSVSGLPETPMTPIAWEIERSKVLS